MGGYPDTCGELATGPAAQGALRALAARRHGSSFSSLHQPATHPSAVSLGISLLSLKSFHYQVLSFPLDEAVFLFEAPDSPSADFKYTDLMWPSASHVQFILTARRVSENQPSHKESNAHFQGMALATEASQLFLLLSHCTCPAVTAPLGVFPGC